MSDFERGLMNCLVLADLLSLFVSVNVIRNISTFSSLNSPANRVITNLVLIPTPVSTVSSVTVRVIQMTVVIPKLGNATARSVVTLLTRKLVVSVEPLVNTK